MLFWVIFSINFVLNSIKYILFRCSNINRIIKTTKIVLSIYFDAGSPNSPYPLLLIMTIILYKLSFYIKQMLSAIK